MDPFARAHLSESSLLERSDTDAGGERSGTAHLLADIAEVEERKSYLAAGYPSLFAWCVGRLRLCDQAAFKRIQAARAARRFPAVFPAVAEGRLHLTAVVMLAPHLTEHTASELLAAAADKSKSEIERLLAARFPKSDLLAWASPIPSASAGPTEPGIGACQLSPGIVQNGTVGGPVVDRSSSKPLSSRSFEVQFTMSADAHEHLRYAQALLGRRVPAGDIAQVIERALAVYVAHLEKTRFAATTRPRPGRRNPTTDSRRIPDPVKRAVWERDGGRCTFVSDAGHRCEAESDLEFDHIEAFARGGEATLDGIRLLCRAHNQYEAERVFGAEFMRHKRIAAAEARATAKAEARAAGKARAKQEAAAARAREAEEHAHELEVVPCLQALGYKTREARDAAGLCRDMRDASLEARVKVALRYFRVKATKLVPVGAAFRAASPTAAAAGP